MERHKPGLRHLYRSLAHLLRSRNRLLSSEHSEFAIFPKTHTRACHPKIPTSLALISFLVKVNIAIMIKSNLRRKGFIWHTHSESSQFTEVSQGRNRNWVATWRQELRQRLWKGADYWLTPRALLILLPYRSQNYQHRGGPTQSDLGPPT